MPVAPTQRTLNLRGPPMAEPRPGFHVVPSSPLPKSWLDDYFALGLQLVFWPAHFGKGPKEEGWQRRRYTREDWRDGFNVGVKTGTAIEPGKFLVDIDFDWDPIPALVERLLPTTGFTFGRAKKPLSHALYTTPTPLVKREFNDLHDLPIVELRGTNKDGTLGHQTMIPPSEHPDDGRLQMRERGDIAHVPDLERCVLHYAIARFLFDYLGSRGCGHDMRMALAGLLLKAHVPAKDTTDILEALIVSVGNHDVSDAALVVATTEEKIRNKTHVAQSAAVAKLIGEDGKAVVARIKEWLGPTALVLGEGDILMAGGQAPDIVDRAEAALLDAGVPIYQRGGILMRPIRVDQAVSDDDEIRRTPGSVVLSKVSEPWLLDQMGRTLRWFTQKGQADPKGTYAATLLSRQGAWHFPVLRAVLTAPTLYGGRIIEAPGFDAESGLYLDIAPSAFPPVPVKPTKDDALVALKRLAAPLRAFPFTDKASEAVALAAMLTALIRASLPTSPLVAYDAPTAGTGKSLLAEIVGLVAMGVRPPALSQGQSEEENEKRLSTVLMAGDPVILMDNCELPIAGAFLCSMLTQEIVQARILGLSERRVLPSTALVLATGNNLTFAGDTWRRAVVCRLDAKMERPETRTFEFNCHAEVLRDRVALVVAGLTILRAYHRLDAADRPTLLPFGSFTDWDWVRGTLVWLGCADPADTRQSILDSNPQTDDLLDVLSLWHAAFLNDRKVVADVAETETSAGQALRDKLIEVACRGTWSSKSVGQWLRRNKDRIMNRMCFRCAAGLHSQEWWVEGANVGLPFEEEQ